MTIVLKMVVHNDNKIVLRYLTGRQTGGENQSVHRIVFLVFGLLMIVIRSRAKYGEP